MGRNQGSGSKRGRNGHRSLAGSGQGNGEIEKTVFDQEENIDDPPSTSVAVGKRMNGFELIVDGGQFYERIEPLLRNRNGSNGFCMFLMPLRQPPTRPLKGFPKSVL